MDLSKVPATMADNNAEGGRVYTCQACGREIQTTSVAKPDAKNETRKQTGQFAGLCEACKKFYSRYRAKIKEEACSCQSKASDRLCRVCRFHRCQAAILGNDEQSKNNQPLAEEVDFAKLPCAVCGVSSSGFCFGVVCCEGCKGFFRRSMKKDYKIEYKCKVSKDGDQLCPASSNCRKCRLQRCVNAGMTIHDVTVGRHTLRRRAEVGAAIRKHSSNGSTLKEKTYRRQVANSEQQGTLPEIEEYASSSKTGCEALGDECDTKTLAHSASLPSETPSTSSSSETFASEQVDNGVCLSQSCDWFIEQAIQAASKLATISKLRLALDNGATEQQYVSEGVALADSYMKSISEFITALPGTSKISLSDRIRLFVQAIFPLSAAQLSLSFDVEKQEPNHFSIVRGSPAWDLCIKVAPIVNTAIQDYLIQAGNRFVAAIGNLKEFSLFCALLLLNPDTPNLENAEMVRSVRYRYELALLHHFSAGVYWEKRLADFYGLIPFFRRSTGFLETLFLEVNASRSTDKMFWSPLFSQLEVQVAANLASPTSSQVDKQL